MVDFADAPEEAAFPPVAAGARAQGLARAAL